MIHKLTTVSFKITSYTPQYGDNTMIKVKIDHSELLYNNIQTIEDQELDEIVKTKIENRVILFNDEWHTFEEVIGQIIKATGCPAGKAESLTLEVHYKGKAVVFTGELPDCLRVSTILEEILLRTQIDY